MKNFIYVILGLACIASLFKISNVTQSTFQDVSNKEAVEEEIKLNSNKSQTSINTNLEILLSTTDQIIKNCESKTNGALWCKWQRNKIASCLHNETSNGFSLKLSTTKCENDLYNKSH